MEKLEIETRISSSFVYAYLRCTVLNKTELDFFFQKVFTVLLEIKPWALCMFSKNFTIKLHLQPLIETEYSYVAYTLTLLTMLLRLALNTLPCLPKHWDYKHVTPCLASFTENNFYYHTYMQLILDLLLCS